MNIFSWISELFTPVSNIIDELNFSGEEQGAIEVKKAELRNKLAEMEFKLNSKYVELQTKAMEANAKVAVAEQVGGNLLSKSWRPLASLMFVALLAGMGLDMIEFKPLLAQIAGGFLGIYGIGRTVENKK